MIRAIWLAVTEAMTTVLSEVVLKSPRITSKAKITPAIGALLAH